MSPDPKVQSPKQKDLDEVVVIVEKVSKTFKLPHERQSSVKGTLLNLHKHRSYELQQVLRDVSFEIKKGDFFGIVGRNGSGKSTLLKILAGIYSPSKGEVKIRGSLVPFIELGVGFNPELTGRENVFLNGALLGFNRKQMRAMYDEIVEFAELDKFMDQKLKNYSSGMQVRLAFSIAIRARGDILLLDEVLAVGDAAFQTKCFDYFEELRQKKATVIFVSHDKTALERFCERGILLNEGEIIETGPIKGVLNRYSQIVMDELERGNKDDKERAKVLKEKLSSQYATIINAGTYGKGDKFQKKFVTGEEISVKFRVKVHKKISNPVLGVTVWQKNINKPVFVTNTLSEGNNKTGEYVANSYIDFEIILPAYLNDGEYYVEPAIANESTSVFYDQKIKASTFFVSGGENSYSLLATKDRIVLRKG